MLYMGVDLGTSSVKVLVVDAQGKSVSSGSQSYSIQYGSDGSAEQHPHIWWEKTCLAIKCALDKTDIDPLLIAGIGLSGQMHGLVTLDKNGQVIRPAIIWLDQRSKIVLDEMDKIIKKHSISASLDIQLYAGMALVSLYWLKKYESDQYKVIKNILLPKDYIRYRLTGCIGTDWTDASGSLAYDMKREQWNNDLINALSLDTSVFPAIYDPGQIAGEVSQATAQLTGLRPGTPVVYGGGDNAMQNIGNGLVADGHISSNIGTGSQLTQISNRPVCDDEHGLNIYPYAIKNQWSIMGASLSGGNSLDWFANNVMKTSDIKTIRNRIEEIVPGSNGLLFLPYLSGERSPYTNANASGILFGLRHIHTDLHIFRAIMEGVIYSLRGSLDIIQQLSPSNGPIIASGGGAKSKSWLQMQSDIFEREVRTTCLSEQACLGAAIMAAVGTKGYKSVADACKQMVSYNKEFYTPISENVTLYKDKYKQFHQLYKNNIQLFKEVNS